jgi:glycosyltransferase 2 family protein
VTRVDPQPPPQEPADEAEEPDAVEPAPAVVWAPGPEIPGVDETSRHGRRRRALEVARYVLLVAVLAAVAFTLWRNWDAVSRELGRLSWPAVLGSLLVGLVPPISTMFGWRVLLADLGTHLPLPSAASVFLVGQLGKYLPGSVWSVVVQTEMGHRLSVPRRRMAVTGVIMLGLSLLGGAVVALPAVPVFLAGHSAVSPWWGVGAVALALVVLWPPVLNALAAWALRLLRRPPLEQELSGGAVLRCMGWVVGAWVGSGLSVWVLARTLAPDAPVGSLLYVCICGYALASVLGMLAVLLPAGIGVRDAVLGIGLATLMSPAAAAAVVVVARFLAVVVDVIFAGAAWLWARRHHLVGSDG